MARTPDELLAVILEPRAREDALLRDDLALLTAARERGAVDSWLHHLQQHLPGGEDEELSEYLNFALLGVCVGFSDRDLSPFVAEHVRIVPALLDDIRAVYHRIKASGAAYSREEFIFRAYDYGIHKACYLEWDLYGSRDLF